MHSVAHSHVLDRTKRKPSPISAMAERTARPLGLTRRRVRMKLRQTAETKNDPASMRKT
ncbi:hypothetical protein BH24ACT26_BH24ACT26_23490 [soil metagenome]